MPIERILSARELAMLSAPCTLALDYPSLSLLSGECNYIKSLIQLRTEWLRRRMNIRNNPLIMMPLIEAMKSMRLRLIEYLFSWTCGQITFEESLEKEFVGCVSSRFHFLLYYENSEFRYNYCNEQIHVKNASWRKEVSFPKGSALLPLLLRVPLSLHLHECFIQWVILSSTMSECFSLIPTVLIKRSIDLHICDFIPSLKLESPPF